MEQNLIDFLNKIHVPNTIIEALKAEKVEDLDTHVTTYLNSRNDFYKASDQFKADVANEQKKTVSGMTLKAVKKVNSLLNLGLTNKEMEEFTDLDTFFEQKAAESYKNALEGLKTTSNEKLIADLNKVKSDYTDAFNKLEEAQKEKENILKAKDTEINAFKNNFLSKNYFSKLVSQDSDLADVPNKGYLLEKVEQDIFSKYKTEAVLDEYGNVKDVLIYNHDGTLAQHPTKPIAVKTLGEIYPYFREISGLQKVSNAGQAGGTYIDPNGKVVSTSSKMGPNEKALLEQMGAI